MEACLGLIFLAFVCCMLGLAVEWIGTHLRDVVAYVVFWVATGVVVGAAWVLYEKWQERDSWKQKRIPFGFWCWGGGFALSGLWLIISGVDNWWKTDVNSVLTVVALNITVVTTLISAVYLVLLWIEERKNRRHG